MKGLSKGRYDETFAGEDDVSVTVLCPRARHRNWYKTEG